MLSNKVHPSEYYPDYFKMDLNLGGSHPHPFALALDETMEEILNYTHQYASTLDPTFFHGTQQRNLLKYHSFEVDTLSDEDIQKFYDSLSLLFCHQGTLKAVRLLGDLYFQCSYVRRGRPYKKVKLLSAISFPFSVSDCDEDNNTLFIRLSEPSTPDRMEEFKRNCRLLIPPQYDVVIADPIHKIPRDKNHFMKAGQPVVLKERRL